MARSKRKGAAQAEAPPEENRDVGAKPQVLNAEHEKMLEWLKTVKFKRVMVGGVDEADVWRRLDELNALYEAALIAERARYDLQLEELQRTVPGRNWQMEEYEQALREKDLQLEEYKRTVSEKDQELEEYAEAASEKLEKYRGALRTAKAEYEKLAARLRQMQGGEGRDDE